MQSLSKKKLLFKYIPITIGIVLFISLILWVGTFEMYDALSNAKLEYLFAAVFSYIIAIFVRSQKLHIILNLFTSDLTRKKSFYYYAISTFLASITPGRMGEPLIVALVKKKEGVLIRNLMPMLVFDRIIDFLIIMIYAMAGSIIISSDVFNDIILKYTHNIAFILLILFILSLFLISIMIIIKKYIHFPINDLKKGFEEISKTPVKLIHIFLFTFLGWLPEILSMYFVMKSFGINISYIQTLSIFSIGILAGVISMVPGGTGTSELSMVVLATSLKFPPGLSTTAFVVNKILLFSTIVILGIIAKNQISKSN